MRRREFIEGGCRRGRLARACARTAAGKSVFSARRRPALFPSLRRFPSGLLDGPNVVIDIAGAEPVRLG